MLVAEGLVPICRQDTQNHYDVDPGPADAYHDRINVTGAQHAFFKAIFETMFAVQCKCLWNEPWNHGIYFISVFRNEIVVCQTELLSTWYQTPIK